MLYYLRTKKQAGAKYLLVHILQDEARTILDEMQGIWEIVPTHMPDNVPGKIVQYKNASITGEKVKKKNS